jgi:hypothetical protein
VLALPFLLLLVGTLPHPPRGPLPTESLVDPLDGHRFTVDVLASVNSLGGSDSDGCSYSSGLQIRNFSVATSPTTLYSARIEEWGVGVTEANKPDLLRTLTELGAEVDDAAKLQPAERYELAAAVAQQLGRDHFTLGDLFLHGAWTVRDRIVGFLPSVQGSGDAWQKLGELITLSRDVTHPRGRTLALFDMARLAHRGGFIHERDSLLAQLDNVPDAGMGAKDKRTEFMLRVRAEERLLRRARDRYIEGIEQQSRSKAERMHYRFLAAELARRLGQLDLAETELAALALDKGAAKDVKGLISDVRSVLRVQARSAEAAISPIEGGSK